MNELYLDLCKVKALLIAGWGQGEERLNKPDKCCLYTACLDIGEGGLVYDALCDELRRSGWRGNMIDYNDAPERTKAEVIDLVQRAANRAAGGESRTGGSDANA